MSVRAGVIACLLCACGKDAVEGQEAGPLWEPVYAPEDVGFYSLPWPSDLRRTADGRPDLADFPERGQGLVGTYCDLYEEVLDGFSTIPVVVMPFQELPEDLALPTPAETLASDADVRLVGLSDGYCGDQIPLELVVRKANGDPFLAETGLMAAPVHGFRLPEATTWALALSRTFGVTDTAGGTARPAGFDIAGPVHQPLRDCYGALGWDLDEVAVATVFTTQSVQQDLAALREHAWSEAPPSTLTELTELPDASGDTWTTWKGVLEVPIYQAGTSPYMTQGDLVFADGVPVVQQTEAVPFVVTWDPTQTGTRPVVIWQSGARASLWGFTDAPLAEELRQTGAVIVKFLPQFHGGRNPDGGDADLHTYNYLNPASGRTVLLQEAVDVTTFVRFITEDWPAELPAVDAEKIALVGHSQGAEVGAMLAAVEPRIDAYVLHGVGTYVADTLVHRTDPFDVPELLGSLLGLTGPVDRFHPVLGLVQMGAERVDPGNYLRSWRGQAGSEGAPHVLVVNGYADDDVYFRSMDALVIGADLTPVAPMGWEPDPFGVWSGEPAAPPLSGNVVAGDGTAVTQATLMVASGDHYTLYENPEARALGVAFLRDALEGQVPRVLGGVE